MPIYLTAVHLITSYFLVQWNTFTSNRVPCERGRQLMQPSMNQSGKLLNLYRSSTFLFKSIITHKHFLTSLSFYNWVSCTEWNKTSRGWIDPLTIDWPFDHYIAQGLGQWFSISWQVMLQLSIGSQSMTCQAMKNHWPQSRHAGIWMKGLVKRNLNMETLS